MPSKKLRIGIYSGAFDPVHAGHVAFALQALREARLDEVILMPERQPRHKPGVAHYAHRVAMIKQALLPHPDLAVMETVERRYSILKTLPALKGLFPNAELVFLIGSDVALSLPSWPYAKQLLKTSELVVGVRSDHDAAIVRTIIKAWPTQPRQLAVLESYAPDVSSSFIRQALSRDRTAKGLLSSVRAYAKREWLYISPGQLVRLRQKSIE